MNTFDIVYLIVILFFTVTFAIKGMKRIIFSLIATAISAFIAVAVGGPVGNIIAAAITGRNDIGSNGFMAFLNNILPNILGTIITFVISFIIIRLLLKIVESKIGKSAVGKVLNRALGALTGLALGVAIVFVFSSFAQLFGGDTVNSFLTTLECSKIYNFLELFKIKF